jgi:hypothetical protein
VVWDSIGAGSFLLELDDFLEENLGNVLEEAKFFSVINQDLNNLAGISNV